MRRILFFIVLLLAPVPFFAQTNAGLIELKWKGIENWTVDSSTVRVLSFDGAEYPNGQLLPYYVERIQAIQGKSYQVEITNATYAPLSAIESSVLSEKNFGQTINTNTRYASGSGQNYFIITILPFIEKDGQIQKLISFELSVTSTNHPQKVKETGIHTYAASSVLASGKFIKIHITDSGIYKLTYEDLQNMGIDPANVRIFGYGGALLDQNFMDPKIDDLPECTIWMEKGSDGVFNAGDYILFYAQGIDSWKYDPTKSMFTHTANCYSNYGYYFVTSDAGTGKKINAKTLDVPQNAQILQINQFTDYQLHEKDAENLISSGKEFYGEIFNGVLSYNFPMTFPNTVAGSTALVRMDVAAAASVSTSFNLSLNSAQTKTLPVGQLNVGDFYELAKGASGTYSFNTNGDTFNFTVGYNQSISTATGYLNYLEVNVRRQLKMSGAWMQFQNTDNLGQSSYNQYNLSSAGSNIKIWDITDPQNIYSINTSLSGDVQSFVAPSSTLSTYIAIDPTASASFPKPVIDGPVGNQNLHAIAPVNMVILTNPLFLSQAQTLAQAHRDKDNLSVAVVTTDQVYNEFSSGAPDATAYRWFMKMLYDRGNATNNTVDKPKYLLLFGKGSFDNRKILPNSGYNYILTYQADNSLVITLSYVTDDYFGMLDDNEGSQVTSDLLDIGVGRFPVTTVQEATDVVNKTIGYMNNTSKGNWKNQICYLADDGDSGLHAKQADSVATSVARKFPAYQINKIYLDAFTQVVNASGESYPQAKTKLMNLIRSGLLVLDYTGHASPSGWANEGILTTTDINALSNNNLPLVIGATCDFLQYDGPDVSGGEQVVLNPSGGGIGILSSARPVYASQNLTLNKLFCENLFRKQNGSNLRIGDVLVAAKNNIGSEINKLCYVYMGDPAIKLNFPTDCQVITDDINQNNHFDTDTLKAMSVATINGHIADNNGNSLSAFNGTLHATVYDKTQQITTLNNDGNGAMSYTDRPNILFSGDAAVTNGTFNFEFMLPKDIKYNFGGGRINYYVQETTAGTEGQGYFENFLIGGTVSNVVPDTIGPDIEMYLNSTNFISGDKVNETPVFMANVSDEHGINMVGSGIGHDISITIDNDPTQYYILNDYYQASANSYSNGTVTFKLPEMINGKHTLTFKIWDLLNNSSTKTIDFEVIKGLTPQIFSVSNYPNPVKTETRIVVNHNRPETVLNTTVEIFDLSGRKVWYFTEPSADDIIWNLTGADGFKVKKGMYLYRVSIKTSDSEFTSKTNKMLITGQ